MTLLQVSIPDEVVPHQTEMCRHCQQKLRDAEVVGVMKRQVFELPPLRLWVSEHQVLKQQCRRCGKKTSGTFPPAVTHPTQYSEWFKSMLVYLSSYQLLPLVRIIELIEDCWGKSISEDTVISALRSSSAAITSSLEVIETGMRVAGQLNWLHVLSTSTTSHAMVSISSGDERR
jgi:transposase